MGTAASGCQPGCWRHRLHMRVRGGGPRPLVPSAGSLVAPHMIAACLRQNAPLIAEWRTSSSRSRLSAPEVGDPACLGVPCRELVGELASCLALAGVTRLHGRALWGQGGELHAAARGCTAANVSSCFAVTRDGCSSSPDLQAKPLAAAIRTVHLPSWSRQVFRLLLVARLPLRERRGHMLPLPLLAPEIQPQLGHGAIHGRTAGRGGRRQPRGWRGLSLQTAAGRCVAWLAGWRPLCAASPRHARSGLSVSRRQGLQEQTGVGPWQLSVLCRSSCRRKGLASAQSKGAALGGGRAAGRSKQQELGRQWAVSLCHGLDCRSQASSLEAGGVPRAN